MNENLLTQLIGWAGAAIGTFIPLPQLIKSWKSKKVNDLSLLMIVMYVVNCCFWAAYGFRTHSAQLVFANGICLVFLIIQLVLKLKYD